MDDIELMANTSEAKTKCFAVWTHLIHEQIIDSEGYLLLEKDSDFEVIRLQIASALKNLTTEIHAKKIITCLKAIVNRRREIFVPQYLIPFIRRHLSDYIENAKRALFMKSNEAYVVDVDHTQQDSDITPKVTIIDQNTGVDLATSQWSEGLHQCVQIKHGCRVNPISMKAVFVSNVNYLKGYSRINGLSGTLGSHEESRTLVDLYQADLIKVPTFRAKRLYEHVPVIAKDEGEWLDAIFEEVADQVKADRSVLIISRSIAEVGNIKNGLIQRYLESQSDQKIVDCYENLIVYQREFDEFDFGDKNKFQTGRLIIATNLAGRGTDIKLCDKLKASGGLHVIVSFLPENSRIEDQAYGRAARCGDPGSGQIIAITEKTDASGKPPSIFDLKVFRDNAEVQRLKSMTDFYNYHTKIEEECLTAFKQHCLEALGNMNNQKKNDNGVPTEPEIIYFALLDEWALWLDSQAKAIKQCAQDRSPQQRAEIIASVKNFLHTHPISPISKALEWINCPQPLIALGLIRINNGNISAAEKIFDNVISKFPEFAGDACYYKGLISQWNVKRVKNIPKIGNENSGFFKKTADEIGKTIDDLSQSYLPEIKDVIPQSLCEMDDKARIKTEDEFLQALQTFNLRADRKKELHTIITRLQQTVGPQIIKSSGFQNQADDISNIYDCLATSAYDMIGHPISFQTFSPNSQTIEDKYKAYQQFSNYLREGYISPKMLNHKILEKSLKK
uniref:Uncharacterized protein n=1 Tax=Panagrolaimus superbus TaxID=310955 RepID=A0A914XWU1_9BILA